MSIRTRKIAGLTWSEATVKSKENNPAGKSLPPLDVPRPGYVTDAIPGLALVYPERQDHNGVGKDGQKQSGRMNVTHIKSGYAVQKCDGAMQKVAELAVRIAPLTDWDKDHESLIAEADLFERVTKVVRDYEDKHGSSAPVVLPAPGATVDPKALAELLKNLPDVVTLTTGEVEVRIDPRYSRPNAFIRNADGTTERRRCFGDGRDNKHNAKLIRAYLAELPKGAWCFVQLDDFDGAYQVHVAHGYEVARFDRIDADGYPVGCTPRGTATITLCEGFGPVGGGK